MRILYFTLDDTPHDFRFLSSLAKTDHQVFVLRLERKGALKEDRQLPENVIHIQWNGGTKPVGFWSGLALLPDLKRVIKDVKPDLIHAGPIQKPALLAALTGFKPLVVMSWGSDLLFDAKRNSFWKWATQYTLSRATMLLGDCLSVREKAISLGFNPERISLFPWGIDLEQFSPGQPSEFIQQLGWKDKFVLLSLRNWEPIYGIDVVVKAFAKASQENDQIRLILLGSGSMDPEIRKLIEVNHLSEKVYLPGRIRQVDLPSYYQSSQLYISASHSDGSSVSLMEALACGLPALVSDIPGNVEWILPGVQGWLFKDGSEVDLSKRIHQAYAQKEKLTRMGKAARLLALERADWKKNFSVLLEAYQKAFLLEQKRKGIQP